VILQRGEISLVPARNQNQISQLSKSQPDCSTDNLNEATTRGGSKSDEVSGFFNSPIASSCTMALGPTQLLKVMSTRNIPEGKRRPASIADSFTAICEPTVWKMQEAQHLTTLWALMACYGERQLYLLPSTVPNTN
jgi:hypothetical protein